MSTQNHQLSYDVPHNPISSCYAVVKKKITCKLLLKSVSRQTSHLLSREDERLFICEA